MPTLPGVLLTWDEAIPEVGEIFVHYNVYRDGVRIATVDTIATPTYTDYLAIPGVAHAYTVTWSANVSGADFDRVNAILPDTIAIRMDDGTWTFRPAPPDADPALTGLADPMHY